MPSFLTTFPVTGTEAVLNDLQGNILKGHGRSFTFNLFLHFLEGQQTNVRAWVANFGTNFVTSARKQFDDTTLFHQKGISGGLFSAFFLSATGYKYLGAAAKPPQDPQFLQGMRASQAKLADPNPKTWHKGLNGDGGTIDAMVLIADTDVHLVRALANAIKLSLAGKAEVVANERGVALHNAQGDGIEHNNYVDGISQPLFFNDDEMPKATDKWDPRATPDLALVPDPGGKNADSMGSYFVFRKLEQNVKGFKDNEKQLASVVFGLNPDPTKWNEADADKAELAGAMLVGRFENGTPVLLSGSNTPKPGTQKLENNFNYSSAPGEPASELKCPFQAHIRKSGPRTDFAGVVENKKHRLVRRGIPFEDKPRIRDAQGQLSDNAAPTGGVGLLFMCYGASIANQFEFVQQTWVNSPTFAKQGTGKDPLIGQPAVGAAGTTYQWPTAWGSATKKPAAFHDFITLRGGEYFFAPSISTLSSLMPTKPIGPIGHLPGLPIDPNLQIPIAFLDPILALFLPDKADAGAGVVHAG